MLNLRKKFEPDDGGGLATAVLSPWVTVFLGDIIQGSRGITHAVHHSESWLRFVMKSEPGDAVVAKSLTHFSCVSYPVLIVIPL